jgi:methyl-accepting chemotaxis protein
MDVSARGRGTASRRRTPVVKLKVANGNGGSHAGSAAPEFDLKKLLRTLQAARDGDFSARLATDHTGLAGKIADTFNELMSSNQRLAEELERAGQMVGKEGKTRVRMSVERRSGAWAEMESSVNTLIDDLLWPTTEVTKTITAVAKGDLTQSVSLEADGRPLKGEFLRSATVVNEMIAQMGVFTSEVTRVAREVGTEGKLGGQAQVLGASGVWKDLTDNVN